MVIGRLADATGALQEACKIMPGNFEAHYKLGSLAMERGQLQKAQQGLARAIELGSKNVYAHLFLGRLYQERGQTDAALGLYATILTAQFRGTDDRIRTQLKIYLEQIDIDQARRLLDVHWPG